MDNSRMLKSPLVVWIKLLTCSARMQSAVILAGWPADSADKTEMTLVSRVART